MLVQRVITAAAGIPLVVLAVLAGGYVFAAMVAGAVFIATLELQHGHGGFRDPASIFTAVLAAALPLAAVEGVAWLLGFALLAVILQTSLLTVGEPATTVAAWPWRLATSIYLGVLAAHFVLLRELDNGSEWLLFAVVSVWVADSGAYFVGLPLGRHKLVPLISPGKTYEGCAGGLIAGLAATFALNQIFELHLSVFDRVALGLGITAVAIIGDLAESAVKRYLGVKDSSGLVPGHGGIADRLDSLLFALPFVYYYLRLTLDVS